MHPGTGVKVWQELYTTGKSDKRSQLHTTKNEKDNKTKLKLANKLLKMSL